MARFREEIRTEITQVRIDMADRQAERIKGFTRVLVTYRAASVGLTVTLVKLIP